MKKRAAFLVEEKYESFINKKVGTSTALSPQFTLKRESSHENTEYNVFQSKIAMGNLIFPHRLRFIHPHFICEVEKVKSSF